MAEWKKVIVSGSSAELNNIFASGNITGSNISSSGDLFASLVTASTTNVVTYDTSTGKFHYTASSNVGSDTIGTPSDNNYADGFFDTFTSNTTIANAIDEISEAFLDLAPVKAPVLTSTTLVRANPAVFSGYLAGGLQAANWYPTGISAYTLQTNLTSGTTVILNTPVGFRIGKNSEITASLQGNVSASRAYGTSSLDLVNSRLLSSGNGTTGIITVSAIGKYNTFWAAASASISDTISQTGSVKYTISSSDAGVTNTTQLFYVGGVSTGYPNQSVTAFSASLENVTYSYLSGIQYYSASTVRYFITASNLFSPVYSYNNISITGSTANTATSTTSLITTIATGSNSNSTPSFNDNLLLTGTATLTANIHSGQNSGSITAALIKPGKSNVLSSAAFLQGKLINTFGADPSTNGSNTQVEYFISESYRMTDLQTTTWNSSAALTNGNLQVRNGRLLVGQYGDYPALTQGGGGAGYAVYYRKSNPSSDNRQNGTLTLTRVANAFASSNIISAWDSGAGELEMAMILSPDVTGPTSANNIYDFGRAVGSDSGNIKGIRNTISTNSSTVYSINWALPSGINTGLAASTYVILWIRYRSTTASDYLTKIDFTYL
jgi:hypothetical protein